MILYSGGFNGVHLDSMRSRDLAVSNLIGVSYTTIL